MVLYLYIYLPVCKTYMYISWVFPFSIYAVDIREIRMVREGTDSKDFEKQQVGLRMIDNFCFIVYYGNEFRLKTLSVAGEGVS